MEKQPTYEELLERVKALEKETTKRLKTDEEQKALTVAVEQSIDGIAMISPEREFMYVNRAYATMHGYSPDEMIGMKVVQVLHTDERSFPAMRAKKQIDTHGSWSGEIEHIRKDGTLFPTLTSLTSLKDNQGNLTATLAICRDITHQRVALKALQEAEERCRALFENAHDAIFIADTKTHRILDANRQAEQLLGRPRKEIIGMHQTELHPPGQTEHYKQMFRKAVQERRASELEAEVITKDGRIVPVRISTSSISILGDQVIQGLFRDLSEEQRIAELKEELAESKIIERAKGILISNYHFTEKEALVRLQKESRRQRKKVKDIAQAVISSESVVDQL